MWVVFWASWCPPCQQETRDLQRAFEASEGTGLGLIGVNVQESADVARDYAETYGLTYRIALDPTAGAFRRWGVFGLPDPLLHRPRWSDPGPLVRAAPARRDGAAGPPHRGGLMARKKTRRSPPTEPAPRPTRGSTLRWLLVGTVVLAGVGLFAVAFLRPSDGVATGVPWARLDTRDVHSLRFPGPSDDRLLFGHHEGVLSSDDGGRRWTPLAFGEDAMGMAAAADGSIVVAGHLVFQASQDGGETWAPIEADLPSLDIHAFARSLIDPAKMWAYLAEGGVYESTDSGATWTKVRDGHVIHLTAIRDGDADVLLGIDPFGGLVRSADGGRTWRVAGTPPASPVASLAATPDGRVLVLGGPDGLYRSDDGGSTWRHVLRSGTVLAAAVTGEGSTVAAVDEDTLFYRSDDGGTTWPGPG